MEWEKGLLSPGAKLLTSWGTESGTFSPSALSFWLERGPGFVTNLDEGIRGLLSGKANAFCAFWLLDFSKQNSCEPSGPFPVSFSGWHKSLLLEWLVCVSVLEKKTFGYFSHNPRSVVAFLLAVYSESRVFSFLTKA